MSVFDFWHTAYESLAAYKLRSGLSILGIVIGVATVVATVAILEGATTAVQSQILEFLNPSMIIVARGSFSIPSGFDMGSSAVVAWQSQAEEQGAAYEKANRLFTVQFTRELQERAPAVRLVVPVAKTQVELSQGRQQTTVDAISTTPEYAEMLNVKVIRGRFLRPEDLSESRAVLVLNESTARELFPRRDPLGQSLNLQVLETSGTELARPKVFTVVGVVREARLEEQPRAYLPIQALQTPISQYLAESKRLEWVEEATKQLRYLLIRRLGASAESWVRSPHQEIESFQEVTRILMLVLGGIAGISLLVGGIGIMNMMLVSVTERTREIGIRKAVGARRRDILVQFLAESTFMSLTGGVLGLLLGGTLAYVGSWVGKWVFVFSALPALVALGVAMLVGVCFGIYPALRAAQLQPVESLRHE